VLFGERFQSTLIFGLQSTDYFSSHRAHSSNATRLMRTFAVMQSASWSFSYHFLQNDVDLSDFDDSGAFNQLSSLKRDAKSILNRYTLPPPTVTSNGPKHLSASEVDERYGHILSRLVTAAILNIRAHCIMFAVTRPHQVVLAGCDFCPIYSQLMKKDFLGESLQFILSLSFSMQDV
jgi:hypothetical protein